ncbi:tail fiber assembly protein [Vibrio pomeroyi]|uniref:Tail fiber assembly protein n=1 Tax=Vibrio pomeroyi TaxID=198832 RepID=A0ABV4N154_9VIBR
MTESEALKYHLNWVRSERSRLLKQCDWTQAGDSPLSDVDKAEWAEYRQELRDLPNGITDITPFEWPSKPAA